MTQGHRGEGPGGGDVQVGVCVRLQRVNAKVPEPNLEEAGQDEELEKVVEDEAELDHQVEGGQVVVHVVAHTNHAARQGLLHLLQVSISV